MVAFFSALQASLSYVRAGNFADKADYVRARGHIQQALTAAGSALAKASTFELFLRAAQIEKELGKDEEALSYLGEAANRIERSERLSKADREYLLDYCDLARSEVEDGNCKCLRLALTEHDAVNVRLRRYYPIKVAD